MTSEHTDFLITGETFKHKESIKATGARWAAAKKCWVLWTHRESSAVYELKQLGLEVKEDLNISSIVAAQRRLNAAKALHQGK